MDRPSIFDDSLTSGTTFIGPLGPSVHHLVMVPVEFVFFSEGYFFSANDTRCLLKWEQVLIATRWWWPRGGHSRAVRDV